MIGPTLVAGIRAGGRGLGGRPTVLHPLDCVLVVCVTALMASLRLDAPSWLTVGLAVCVGATVLLYFAAYVYCLLTDKEALRSESYSIQKLAIEKGLVRDSLAGVFPAEVAQSGHLIAAPGQAAEEERK